MLYVRDWRRRGVGFVYRGGAAALIRRGLFASRHTVVTTSMVIGATRALAFSARIRAFAKRGQMAGGPGDSLDHEPQLGTGVISERIHAYDA